MAANPDQHSPQPPGHPRASLPAGTNPLDSPDQDCLTPEQIAELSREELELCWPDPDDPQYAEDLEAGPPGCMPYTDAEYAQQLADEDERARREVVPEAIDAGFTHNLGGNGNGFSAGGPLDVMLPGADLGRHVIKETCRGLGTLTDDQLIGLLAANRREKSLHEAIETDLVAELDRRRTTADSTPGEHVDQEVAAALTLTSWSADALLSLARDLQRLPKTRDLLANGIIDIRRAGVIARHTAVLCDANAARVEDLILPRAGEMTTGELGSLCLRAVLKVDPDAARRRKEKALKDARVETWFEDAGTAALCGRDLPPADVIAADKRIDAIARWLKANGAPGTLDELRARVYLAILNDQPIESLLPTTPDDTGATDTTDPAGTSAAGTTGTPSPTSSDSPAAAGPQAAGPQAAGPQAAGPQAAGPQADRSQADRSQTGRTDTGAPGGTGGTGGTGPGAPGAGVPPGGPGGLTGAVHLTMPYDTWQGLTDNPGEIAGYGAADVGTCRDIARQMTATPATRWCITLTDRNGRPVGHGCARAGPSPPDTGDPASWLATITIHPIETGTCAHLKQSAAYQPSSLLRHIVKTRSRRCGFPGCRRAAVRCDDDHTIAYHLGGRTCECNLYPLCRRHHQCKQAPGWHLEQPWPGELIWTSPSGRRYTKITEPYPV